MDERNSSIGLKLKDITISRKKYLTWSIRINQNDVSFQQLAVISKTGTDFYFLHIWMTNLVININYFGLGFVFMLMDLTGLPKSLRKYKVILVFLTYKSKIAFKEIRSLHKKSNKHFSDSTWNKWTSIMAKICGINLHYYNQPIFYWDSLFLCNLSVVSCKIWLEWYKFGRCNN